MQDYCRLVCNRKILECLKNKYTNDTYETSDFTLRKSNSLNILIVLAKTMFLM